ncbi:putative ATP-dependent R helicase RhlE-like [Daphnia sinensis]|uniref:ATP-dependent R helicase RhlE-like n=1 Tax=Daphnia sinensis TaxID=1820382 RepID=A0AAD5PME2_9CRUS|nr:putative ATP-dependent R helicase RhlE-like [Daphnia sinensis]
MKHAVIFGGVSQGSQVAALKAGVDILIATPGRLLDLINQKFVQLHYLKIFVLDEADRMLDMGFIHDVKKLITKIPQKRQTLFFSATMPDEIQKLANTILVNPEKKIKSALIFSRTKHGADKITKDLVKAGIKTEAIHGNKSQNARQKALSNFKSGQIKALIATDIAARGIDIDELSHVINYELPNVPETYVHRIGRTGRAGYSGVAYSFCDEEEMEYLKDIQKLIGKDIPVVEDQPYHMRGAAYIFSQSTKKKVAAAKKGKAKPGAASMSGSPNRRFSNKRR